MLRFLLDTNLCIRVLRDRPAGLRARFNAEAGGLCISDVVLFELLYGAEKSVRPAENRGAVERGSRRGWRCWRSTARRRGMPRRSGRALSGAGRRSGRTTS